VNIDRFLSKKYSENKKFYSKIFTKNEINYCTKFKNPYTHFADKFALKEAVIKAIKKNINFLDIEILHQKEILYVNLINYPNSTSISSISHENTVAIAVFLIEF
jgi:holo-[acyl-carrier protein] synthase